MFYIMIILALLATWFARQEYINGRVGWAMFWSCLLGWDLHTLLILL